MKDWEVIEAFVSYLRKHGYPALKVDRWPDKENRNSPDIDAIAGRFAIEHTSIDTLPYQRRENERFLKVVGGFREEFAEGFPFRMNIYFDFGAITTGQDWPAIRRGFRDWIEKESPKLPYRLSIIEGANSIPFRFRVIKETKRIKKHLGVRFGRLVSEDKTLPDRIRMQFKEKAEKLGIYKANGKTTILLIESDDFQLMNHGIMFNAITDAFGDGLPGEIDQIWFADTSIPEELEFMDFTSDLHSALKCGTEI
jgi:hypothetical protein